MKNDKILVRGFEFEQNALSGFANSVKNLVGRFFGCWHSELSRPFTFEGESYRMCLDCGARRRFIPATWTSVGTYYRKSASTPGTAEYCKTAAECQSTAIEAPMTSQRKTLLPGHAFYEITQFP